MGYITNHAIVVEGYLDEKGKGKLKKAHNLAKKICASVTPITKTATNGSRSFLVAPDGSKEGWGESNDGDCARSELKDYLRGSGLDWVEVQFGGDDAHLARVLDCNGWKL